MSVAFSTPTSNMDIGPKAPQACMSCRKQKRKCNKALPACALCERMGRACDYSDSSPAPTSDDFNALRAKLFELESRLNGSNGAGSAEHSPYIPTPGSTLSGNTDSLNGQAPPPIYIQQDPAYHNIVNRFPAIAFLDQEAFKYGGISIPKPNVDIPVEVLELLGDGSAVQAVITDFFDSIHTWMPIISKKRLTRNMLNPMWEAGPDLALLFLCMKLMITRPQEGVESPQNPLYTAAKRFIALMEANGLISVMILQGYILIALYEMGQGIYPAAWMTVGAASRYGTLLGLNDNDFAPQLLPMPATWTEAEERKRTWFGVIIIDRMVAIGSMGLRPLSCDDPPDDVKLPVDTTAWDEGQMTTSPALGGTSSLTDLTFPFARLCQAAIYLGRVLKHHHTSRRLPETERFRLASDLYLEISALTQTIAAEASASQDYLPLSAPLAVCFAALSTLCDPYACTETAAGRTSSNSVEEASMQVQAIEGLKGVSSNIKDFAEQIIARTPHSLDVDRVSPLIMDALYAAAANYAWLVRESGDEDSQLALERIRHCLRRLGGRWKTALEFVRVLEAQEFTYAIGSHVA